MGKIFGAHLGFSLQQMVVVPFLRNNPSAVMFFQRFIFPAKTLWEKYSERIWVFFTFFTLFTYGTVVSNCF
jgi:hypothetical protein